MTSSRRLNLERLLNPRHVAVIGGREAETVAGECARIGYRGPVWPVNPRRESIGGHRCLRSVDDLPEPPDAAFVAVPREAAIDTVARLAAMGAGGAVCHTAGFAETGGEGARLEAALATVAIEPPAVPILHNVDVETRSSGPSIRSALSAQLASPVRWRQTVVAMRERGAATMVEFGPGRVLTGLARRVDRSIAATAVHDGKSLDTALATVADGGER